MKITIVSNDITNYDIFQISVILLHITWKLVPFKNSLKRPNKWKSGWLPDLDCKEDMAAVPNQTVWWFPLFLHCLDETQMTTDLRKCKVFRHNFICCTLRNYQLSRNVLYYNYSVSQNDFKLTESTISGVLAIVRLPGLSSFWILFSFFLNNLAHLQRFFD